MGIFLSGFKCYCSGFDIPLAVCGMKDFSLHSYLAVEWFQIN